MSDLQDLSADLKALHSAFGDYAQAFLRKASSKIGNRAAQNHMRRAGSATSRRSAGDKGPLRIVQGRLANSLTGAWFDGKDESINDIETLASDIVRLIKGSKVPYAAIHEYGGQIDHTVKVTERMRRFFWAKHYETGQSKWKGMALTKKDRFKIQGTIPERSYLRAALDNAMPELLEMGREDLGEFIRDSLGA